MYIAVTIHLERMNHCVQRRVHTNMTYINYTDKFDTVLRREFLRKIEVSIATLVKWIRAFLINRGFKVKRESHCQMPRQYYVGFLSATF